MKAFGCGRVTGFSLVSVLGIGLLAGATLQGAAIMAPGRYALILQDEPAVKVPHARGRRNAPEVASARAAIRLNQTSLQSTLERRGFHVTGSVSTLLNAVFVTAKPSDVAALRSMPGVKNVIPMRKIMRPQLNAAVNLVGAVNAWNALGGTGNAGAGLAIGIIDTGIDQTHPAFQDSTLSIPAGFPICNAVSDCTSFTNNKVIVARSYVAELAANTGPSTSFPDDVSARDRVGHGTAVAMCAAGNTNTSPLGIQITGLAPKAYLGSYKVFGSPEINDGSTEDVFIQAIDDAYSDGMSLVNISSGAPPFSGPLDTGAICGNDTGDVCDALAAEVEAAIAGGMAVVAAAGNDGYDDLELNYTLNSISSPGDAPDSITVGASGNSHIFENSVQITGSNVPSNLQNIAAYYGDGPVPSSTLTAPLVDAATAGDGYACTAFANGAFNNDIVLVEDGAPAGNFSCDFLTKVQNVQNAGASGVIIYQNIAGELLFPPTGLGGTDIPAFEIGYTDGVNLKNYVDATSGAKAGLNPALSEQPASDTNQITYFSSRGPAIGTNGVKPDVVAPGENIYTAAQNFDPLGELYDPSRYGAYSGTSFSTPIVSGIAALVWQANPSFTPAQLRSALVNTATNDTTDPWYTGSAPSTVLSAGGGKVNASNAIATNVTVVPASLSFGALTSGFSSGAQTFSLTNTSSGSLTLSLAVNRLTGDALTQMTLSSSSVTLLPGASQNVTLTLSGSLPNPGVYQGSVTVNGGSVALHIPYLYLVGDGIPQNVYALSGDDEGDLGVIGSQIADGMLALRVTDQYGVPVANLPVSWAANDGGTIDPTYFSATTDQNGFAYAVAYLGDFEGEYSYTATISGYPDGYTFYDLAVSPPSISSGGMVNAASFLAGDGIAPGSYVSIFGIGLTLATTDGATTSILPIAIDGVSVGVDATGVEVPAPMTYAGFNQINIQVPWELAGQTGADFKVDMEYVNGQLYSVPVVTYSPAMFVANNQVAALDANYALITSSNPAVAGQTIQIYCNGLGPVTNQPATGFPASANPLSETTTVPTVNIGGQDATVSFHGLAPGFPALYQLNVVVPSGLTSGLQPVTISIGGVTSPAVNMAIQ